MEKTVKLAGLGFTIAFTTFNSFAEITVAQQSLIISFPSRAEYQTSSDKMFFLGSAPPAGNVLVNGQPIQRSPAGHFAPRFSLNMGENIFIFRYQNQEKRIKVNRISRQATLPNGLAFAENSLSPATDIARLPGELICFSAIAPTNATVTVKLANQNIPLYPQGKRVELPSNLAVLADQNQPKATSVTGKYEGCAVASEAGELGFPEFQLTANGNTVSQVGQGRISILTPTDLEIAEVIVDAGVARTGPSTDHSRLTPLPKGTLATITGREGEWVRLDYGAWIKAEEVRISKASVPPKSIIRSVSARQIPGATQVIFPLQVPVPVSVQQGDRTFTLTLYNTTAQTDIIRLDDNPLISRLDWQQVAPNQVQYTFNLKSGQQWGYQLKYEGTSLVLTLRHSPTTSSLTPSEKGEIGKPLTGITILLDPGHGGTEPGAAGPNGYLEKDVNLSVSRLLRDELVAKGATVYMTREDDSTVSLQDRMAMIDRIQPAIALSVHYNSLPDYGDAFNTSGVGTFWYHPQAHSLAVFLQKYMVQKLNRPSYGVFWNNLALTRPHSAPSVLLELGFMSNPFEFEWVTNPQEQSKLAATLANAITEWFKQ
ncbi:N-acetylmuramoyl-L-alanine amidase [[Phormidium ambiguum] IAM M-71]|uniref:N-acetylmuramoyl-L-alanine amidase n=1 Tax=[Phormidium ambiguum] IAM M-71 TaxID=454136 RepID=UPI000A01E299|nr:N-acetylmuramoyl-L-alanine amidase [Phormidium ambiguum]